MHNGTTVIDDYGQNLDKLKVGDRVAVVRKDNGVLHFFVNSEDCGPAASNIPDRVYGKQTAEAHKEQKKIDMSFHEFFFYSYRCY